MMEFDSDVKPLAIENNPDGSGRRVFLELTNLHGFVVVDLRSVKRWLELSFLKNPINSGKGIQPATGIGVAPDGKSLWVVSRPANSLYAYSLPDIKLLGRVALPELHVPGKPPGTGGPGWIGFSGDSKTVYVTNRLIRSASAIDIKAMKTGGGHPARGVTRPDHRIVCAINSWPFASRQVPDRTLLGMTATRCGCHPDPRPAAREV